MRTGAVDLATRPPAVAGRFYQADLYQLRAEVRQLLAGVPETTPKGPPKAIHAPHAGYRYSGKVAATAFAALAEGAETIRRVILIGPAHYVQSMRLRSSSRSYR